MLTTGISSYLVGILDSFVNEFGILFLIGVQCIIFGWIYGLDHLVPVLNENGHLKVGRLWKLIIKYILPIFLILIWVIGIIKLFSNAKFFELIVECIIIVAVFLVSIALTRIKASD